MTDSSTTAQQSGSGRAQTLLALEDVSKSFGDLQVLRDVSLSMERGEVLVVVGPSGGGKSTLCRTINRLEPIDSGRILFDGKPLPAEGRELARHRADVGMVFQSFNLFAHKTILDHHARPGQRAQNPQGAGRGAGHGRARAGGDPEPGA
jgi:glutamate transport system ATP-binding protein